MTEIPQPNNEVILEELANRYATLYVENLRVTSIANQLLEQRDALQAQLDAFTTETTDNDTSDS